MTARAQSISGLRSDGYSSDSIAYIGSYPDGYQPTSGLTLTTTSSGSLLKDRDSPAITARARLYRAFALMATRASQQPISSLTLRATLRGIS